MRRRSLFAAKKRRRSLRRLEIEARTFKRKTTQCGKSLASSESEGNRIYAEAQTGEALRQSVRFQSRDRVVVQERTREHVKVRTRVKEREKVA
jgi:hypothetical protein